MNRSPLILAIVLLLLPVLYVGSYLALVDPATTQLEVYNRAATGSAIDYRVGGQTVARLFWPLEQIDQRLRPGLWETTLIEREYRAV